ncbi:hypothetical protein BBJ29_000966 [Phytophthora kernoviae]|uniref:Translation elongation factor EF1B beta/delta subunit guanine nucleotide exchange domain-containing protein n=1 Tax=Phytophthora kernoviae TaxID=325452 RepID=A0A3F2RWL4_9STRA|nr:hypothetical protein BBJ29_000966 [Phytophthora kernoviae]RLN65131.1 hypothetical protein BBP00_00003023 [Phytophthora kernoviae]
MGISFDNLDQDAGLKKLNGFLTSRSYIEGYQFSAEDVNTFHKFSTAPDANKYANVYRWYVHIAAKLGLRAILEKKKPVERSQVVLEVKPWEAETNLEELAAKIKALPVEGLTWGEGHKLVPVAFGIKKLLVQCVIIDDLVLLDDITDSIEQFEDYVQSVDVASMNKL